MPLLAALCVPLQSRVISSRLGTRHPGKRAPVNRGKEGGGFDKNWAGKNEEKDDGTNWYHRLFLGSLSGGRLGQVLRTAPLVRQVW